MVTRTRTGHNQVECSLKRREKIIENMSFTHFSKVVWISDMSLFLNQPEFSCRCVKFLTYLKDICKRPASCLVFFSVGSGGAGAIAGKTPSVIIRLYMIGIVFPDRIVLFLVLKKYCAWKSSSDAKLDFSSWNNLTIGRSGWVSAKLPWNQLVQSIYTWGLSFFLKIALA